MSESPVKKFNQTVNACLGDFKVIFGENDSDIRIMQGAYEMTKVNVRLLIVPFQQYITGNPDFVTNIIEMNTDYFIGYDFEQLLKQENALDEYSNKLIHKFREATIARKDDHNTIKAIFNWFKVMMYYAFMDQGIDMKTMVQAKNTSS